MRGYPRINASQGRGYEDNFSADCCFPRLEGSVLHCASIVIDNIIDVGPRLHPTGSIEMDWARNEQSDAWVLWVHNQAAQATATGQSTTHFLSAVSRVLFQNTVADFKKYLYAQLLAFTIECIWDKRTSADRVKLPRMNGSRVIFASSWIGPKDEMMMMISCSQT